MTHAKVVCPCQTWEQNYWFVTSHGNMAPQITQQLREWIIFWQYEEYKTASEISSLVGCTKKTIFNILHLYWDFRQGVNNPYKCQCGCPCVVNTGNMNYISSTLEANPTLYIDEIQQRLLKAQDCNVSIATICCTVRRLVLTHKKVA